MLRAVALAAMAATTILQEVTAIAPRAEVMVYDSNLTKLACSVLMPQLVYWTEQKR